MPVTGLSNRERPPYVIFVKGTPAAYAALEDKDQNTLYYISEKGSAKGTLYLGDKLIAGGGGDTPLPTSLADLSDVFFTNNLPTNSILTFDGRFWTNKTVNNIVGTFQEGKPGLVPAPAENEKEYFLRGDGTWAQAFTILQHTITIGDQVFDGSQDIKIEVYDGSVNDMKPTMRAITTETMQLSTTDNMELNDGRRMSEVNNVSTYQMTILNKEEN